MIRKSVLDQGHAYYFDFCTVLLEQLQYLSLDLFVPLVHFFDLELFNDANFESFEVNMAIV